MGDMVESLPIMDTSEELFMTMEEDGEVREDRDPYREEEAKEILKIQQSR